MRQELLGKSLPVPVIDVTDRKDNFGFGICLNQLWREADRGDVRGSL